MRYRLTALSTPLIAAVAMLLPTTASAHTRSALTTTTLYISKPQIAGVMTGGMGYASWPKPSQALHEGTQEGEFAFPETYRQGEVTKKLGLLDFANPGIPAGATIDRVCVSFQLFNYPGNPGPLFNHWFRVDVGLAGAPKAGYAWNEEPLTRITGERVCGPWGIPGMWEYRPTVAELDSGAFAAFFASENLNGANFDSVAVNDFVLEVEAT